MKRYIVALCAFLTALLFAPSYAGAQETTVLGIEAESMSSTSAGGIYSDASAGGGKYLYMWSNGTASKTVSLPSDATRFHVRARGDQCGGAPHFKAELNDVPVASAYVSATSWTVYSVDLPSAASGSQRVEITYDNDYQTFECDRNLMLDRVSFSAPSTSPPSPDPLPDPSPDTAANPFSGQTLYIDPAHNPAKTTADQWRSQGRTADADQMDKIAKTARSKWANGSSSGLTSVETYLNEAASAGQMPVLTLYAIPYRDCGSYSAGGLTPSGYRSYVDSLAAAIGTKRAAVVVEPDALADLSCLSWAQVAEREGLIKYAVEKLKANPYTAVYIDGGHARWQSASTMVDRLKLSGIETADGFALNASNFITTDETTTYGKSISAGVGDKHFVIDTSRNGLGPYTGDTHDGDCPSWANPPDRALGERAGYKTPSDPVVDAFVWIKPPGESDADCGGFPSAGGWDPDYALGVAQRANWSL